MSITINQCPHCRVFVQDGRIRWSCDDSHPEVLAFIELEEDDDAAFQSETDYLERATGE